jgi:pyrimidine-nucleoside phosphorylase
MSAASIVDIIRRKRDGGELGAEEIRAIVQGAASQSVPDYQLAAWLMAVFLRGFSEQELDTYADAMMRSGRVLDLSGLPGPTADKHSTGGVGDKISLCLAPLVAACGVYVPMISGRGLGHTGGTLDKMSAIAGYQTALPVEQFLANLRSVGWSIIGQTDDLCPADRRLYALRDVTGTVESIPLIAASILSKKLAEGSAALVLDVKVGSGAFMKSVGGARQLAQTMCGIGRRLGRRVSAFLTNMDQPLGRAAGNAMETAEAVDVLRGAGPQDVVDLTVILGAEMLRLAGAAPDALAGQHRIRDAIASGAGYERWCRGVRQHGGDPEAPLPISRERHPVRADRSGYVTAINTEALGVACVELGAGRRRVDDIVDPSVGILVERKVGDQVNAGDPLAIVLGAHSAVIAVKAAYTLDDSPPTARPLIVESLLQP